MPLFYFCASFLCVAFIERYAVPAEAQQLPSEKWMCLASLSTRIYCVLVVYLVFFLLSVRPVYSLVATVTFFTVFVLITRAKVRFVREPLVFADLALLPLLLRHRELFHANWLGLFFWAGSSLYIVGVSFLFFMNELPLLPEGKWRIAAAVGLILAAIPVATLLLPVCRGRIGGIAARILDKAEPVLATQRFGPFAYIVLHYLQWLGHERVIASWLGEERRMQAVGVLRRFAADRPPVILVWQSESFLDMRRYGVATRLPVLDRLRAQAVRHGLIESVFQGGYTMRTEFSVLTGLPPDALGPDAYHPYLTAEAYAVSAWPRAFSEAGMRTVFVHPYDPAFFHRHRAMPALGFDELLMRDAFEQTASDNRYVSDAALGRRIVEICRRETSRSLFLFCASMENHGPWKAGPVDGAVGAEEIYMRTLERSDQALGKLVEALDGLDRPVWLLFYGDHPPLLDCACPDFADARTDYFILPAGRLRHLRGKGEVADSRPWELIGMLAASASTAAGCHD